MTTFPLNTQNARFDITAIGNAIVDILARVDDEFLTRQGMSKGGMTLIDAERAEAIYAELSNTLECSGGSVANSIAAIASLGGRCGFMGRVNDDGLGEIYRHDLRSLGIAFDTKPATGNSLTGRCYVCVTPDGERTMNTYLGASTQFAPEDIDAGLVEDSAILFLEGYLWNEPGAKEAIHIAIDAAKRGGRAIAFTLSAIFCIEAHFDDFRQLTDGVCDIVFCNEDEAKALSRLDDLSAAAAWLGSRVKLAVVTCGAEGAIIHHDGKVQTVPSRRVEKVIDQTGAGDLFAAGFLYGVTKGFTLEKAAKLGHACAAEIIGQLGARSQTPLARLIAL